MFEHKKKSTFRTAILEVNTKIFRYTLESGYTSDVQLERCFKRQREDEDKDTTMKLKVFIPSSIITPFRNIL